MKRTRNLLNDAKNSVLMGTPIDLISIDIRDALDVLGEVNGEVTREDVINQIFAQFFIGK